MISQPVLVLEKYCSSCSLILSRLNLDKIGDSTYSFMSYPRVLVYISLAPDGTKYLLDSLFIKGVKAPVLVIDGKEITKVNEILNKLRDYGYLLD